MMHPRDAAARGLTQGSEVKVWNERGEVILPLDVTDDVPPGVVASEKGAWLATSRTGRQFPRWCRLICARISRRVPASTIRWWR